MLEQLALKETKNENETMQLGREISERLLPGDTIAIVGPLGAGKTTIIKGICKGLGVADVTSPTFTIVNCYDIPVAAFGEDSIDDFINEFSHNPASKTRIDINHIDLYRIDDEKEFIERGIAEYIGNDDSITLVEWADHFPEYFQEKNTIWIEINPVDGIREVKISKVVSCKAIK
ncbi:MAG: tRNA (adenosine(37)-N6)-threonylcarbamoyltransferase complex ATPase subunit type 1 TsaE [Candidatus Zixiibacteriota bacterium]